MHKSIKQPGEWIVYIVPAVRGVKTNAVIAECTVREAIERMVDRTPLKARRNEKTKEIAVTAAMLSRAPSPRPPAGFVTRTAVRPTIDRSIST
jgi:hypothetical protein